MKTIFENAQKLAQKSPDTFYAPPAEELAAIMPGDCVKVCARGVPGEVMAERFWLLVHEIQGELITGEVNNNLLFHPLELGELVTVHTDNVYDIHTQTAGNT